MLIAKTIIRTLISVPIIVFAIQSICYGLYKTSTRKIELPFPNDENPSFAVFPGEKNTYLCITTEGIKVAEQEELVTPIEWDWDGVQALVIAKCVISESESGATNAKSMFHNLYNESNKLPTLQCRRGEGIRVEIHESSNMDSNEYQYVAKLTIDREIRKKRSNSSKKLLSTTMPSHSKESNFVQLSFSK